MLSHAIQDSSARLAHICVLPRVQDKRTGEAGYEARLRKAEEHVNAIAAAAEARSQSKMLAEVERYKVGASLSQPYTYCSLHELPLMARVSALVRVHPENSYPFPRASLQIGAPDGSSVR